jgi:ribosome recycling factor
MLTEENRMKLVKVLKEKLEDARISIRKERESVLNDIKTIPSEDEIFNAKQELQELVDKANANLEALFDKKEKEVLN